MKKYCKANIILSFINLIVYFLKNIIFYEDPCQFEFISSIFLNYTPFDYKIAYIINECFDKIYSLISIFLIINMIIIIIVNIIFSIKKVKYDFYSISIKVIVFIILNIFLGMIINLFSTAVAC